MAQARLPCFYRDYGIADTVNGHFEGSTARTRAGLFDHLCRGMDDNLREIGVCDLAVPKRMYHVGEAFYERARAYRSARALSDVTAWVEVVMRNLYAPESSAIDAVRRLGVYINESVRGLNG